MNRINKIFTLFSLTTLIIIVERLLPYTKSLVQPYAFIQIHQLIQTIIFILLSVALSFFAMKIITHDFEALKDKQNALLAVVFVIGAYFYGAGEGWHEVALFTLNQYCNIHSLVTTMCGGLYINSYYVGNIIFFIGGGLMSFSLLALAKKLPTAPFTKKELTILIANSIVFAFTWFAYAAFDVVSVGFFFATLLMIISLFFFLQVRRTWKSYPYILYSVIAYTLATLASGIIRFF